MTEKIKCCIIFIIALLLSLVTACAEQAEQGVEKIQHLVQMTQGDEREGMSLEDMTKAFSENAMSQYADSASGFRMQYPSVFLFDEEAEGNRAVTEDGKASLEIINHEGVLPEDALVESIRLLIPDAKPEKNEQNGCLQVDTTEDEGKMCRTDLYFLTQKSFHHIIIKYPAGEKEIYSSYIEYMINTMETKESEQG
jgi:hypothetical protein